MNRTRAVSILAVVALTLTVIPAMAAENPRAPVTVGVVGHGVYGTGGPNGHADRIHVRDVAPGRLTKTDALLLDDDALDDLLGKQRGRSALKAFAATGKPIFVKGGDLLTLSNLLGAPLLGQDGEAERGVHLAGGPLAGAEDVPLPTDATSFVGARLAHVDGGSVPVLLEIFVEEGAGDDVAQVARWVSTPGFTGGPDTMSMSTTSTQSEFTGWTPIVTIKGCVSHSSYGDVCSENRVMFQSDDGTKVYDFWANSHQITTYPGIGYYGTKWRAYRHLAYSDVDSIRPDHQLIDHDPPSQDHNEVVTADIGTTAGEFGAVYTVRHKASYGLEHVSLSQASSISNNYAYVIHTIDQGTVDSDTSYYSIPGYVVRTPDGVTYENSHLFRAYWRHAGTGDVVYTGGYASYSVAPPQTG